jgi:phosphoserine phosphatase
VQVPSNEIKTLIRNAQAFCFDVDSTVIQEEGIDKLAEFKGVGKAVSELTSKYIYYYYFFFQ